MEKRANYALVGLSAIILIVVMIAFVVWLSLGWNRQVYNTYMVYMNQAVSGLNPEAPVQFNGVNVGNVDKISLNPTNPQQVILYLHIKQGTPITTSTTATLASQGITGISYIALAAASPDAPLLTVQAGNPYPVIPSALSFFSQLDTLLRGTSVSLQALLSPENINNISKTILNVRMLTDTLAAHSDDIAETMQQAHETMANFNGLAQQGNVAAVALVTLLSRLNAVSTNLEQLSLVLKQNPSVLLRGTSPAKLGPGE